MDTATAYLAAHKMLRRGGNFAGKLAAAYFAADESNREKMAAAFADLFTAYAEVTA